MLNFCFCLCSVMITLYIQNNTGHRLKCKHSGMQSPYKRKSRVIFKTSLQQNMDQNYSTVFPQKYTFYLLIFFFI